MVVKIHRLYNVFLNIYENDQALYCVFLTIRKNCLSGQVSDNTAFGLPMEAPHQEVELYWILVIPKGGLGAHQYDIT